MSHINLKSVVSRQLPEFVRADYPAFVEFVQAYYEYLDQYEKRNLEEIRDVDQTLDSFIKYFKKELDILGDNYENIDQRLFLRKAKQLFTAKGTESSYKFLFKALYNKNINVNYPWDKVLKASDGKWKQETSIFLKVNSGNPENLVGNRIAISGQNIIIYVFVDRVSKYINPSDPLAVNIYEVFIDKNYNGTIHVGYTVNNNGVTGSLVSTSSSYEIISGGVGFSPGQIFDATTIAKGATITQKIKVVEIDVLDQNTGTGSIKKIEVLKFGCNFDLDFYVGKSVVAAETQSLITINRAGTLQYSISDDSQVEQYSESGILIEPNWVNLTYGNNTYAGVLLNQFYEETLIGQNELTNFAIIKFNVGAVAKYKGYYIKNDGFLDDEIYIQDSRYWQKYSYVISSDVDIDKYKTLLKSLLHPAGTAMFGEYLVKSTFNPTIVGQLLLDEWRPISGINEINRSIVDDYVYASDLGGHIRLEPYDSDYSLPDGSYNPPLTLRMFGDARNVISSTVNVDDGDFTGTLYDEVNEGVAVSSTEPDINLNSLTLNGGTVDMNTLSGIPTIDLENNIGTNDLSGL